MGANGGAQMWCPACEEITVCKAVGLRPLTGASGQRWRRTDHADVNWFRRGRECQSCGDDFVTAEIDEQFIDELVELRDALRELKLHAESYVRESRTAQESLGRLTESLDVLRALDVYKAA